VFDRPLGLRVAGLAVLSTSVCLGVAVWSRASDGPWQTQLFVALAAVQLALALALRPRGAWRRSSGRGSVWVPVAVAVNVLLLVAGVYLPGLSDLLGTEPLSMAEFGVPVVAALLPAVAVLIGRRVRG
jgi:Ca2+-transporting ATPase